MIKIDVSEKNGWAVLAVDGQIDLHTSPDIRKELAGRAKAKKARIAIDLTRVSYIDSSGLATFIEAMQKLKKGGGEIALCGLSESVRHVFEVARLDSIFAIHASSDDLK
ncbi:MAG TPA: STAS domain-containing protein [bacterium]|nr:STAS domain-containing protein [bacterium]